MNRIIFALLLGFCSTTMAQVRFSRSGDAIHLDSHMNSIAVLRGLQESPRLLRAGSLLQSESWHSYAGIGELHSKEIVSIVAEFESERRELAARPASPKGQRQRAEQETRLERWLAEHLSEAETVTLNQKRLQLGFQSFGEKLAREFMERRGMTGDKLE